MIRSNRYANGLNGKKLSEEDVCQGKFRIGNLDFRFVEWRLLIWDLGFFTWGLGLLIIKIKNLQFPIANSSSEAPKF
jgi:hypothetical protein